MEKVKEILLVGGKAALDSAVELGRSVVQLAARLGGTAASFVGKRPAPWPRSIASPLLLAAAVVSGVLAVGSVVLWLVCRKKVGFLSYFYNRAGDAVRLPAADRKEESIYGKKRHSRRSPSGCWT